MAGVLPSPLKLPPVRVTEAPLKLAVGSQTRLQLRADFYNFLNRAQFAEPISDPSNPAFGRITRTALSSRTLQLGVHLYF